MAMTIQEIIAKQKAEQEAKNAAARESKEQPAGNPPAAGSAAPSVGIPIALPGKVPIPVALPPKIGAGVPLPGLKIRLPVASGAGVPVQSDSASPVSPVSNNGVKNWDDVSLDDFTPARDSAPIPTNYGLPQDHIPVPERNLPSDATPQQLEFIAQLDSIYGLLHDAELFSQVIRNLMLEMKQDPNMCELVADSDKRAMVRGMRESLGVARQQKQARAKSTTSASKRKSGVKDNAAWDAALNEAMGL